MPEILIELGTVAKWVSRLLGRLRNRRLLLGKNLLILFDLRLLRGEKMVVELSQECRVVVEWLRGGDDIFEHEIVSLPEILAVRALSIHKLGRMVASLEV